jgi:hypothetical protein
MPGLLNFGLLLRLRRLSDPALTVLVVLELIAIFINLPLTDLGLWPAYLDFPLELLIIAAAIMVVSCNRSAVTAIVIAFLASFAATAFRSLIASHITTYIDFASKLTFIGVLTWIVGIGVFSSGRITSHRIIGAVAIYLQIALLFALSFLIILTLQPNAFSPFITLTGPTGDILRGAHGGSQMVYFSLSTLTTTGYGDIVPVHPLARSLANLEALIGQLFPATLLARLVTLEVSNRRR